jgi:dynein heavy chain
MFDWQNVNYFQLEQLTEHVRAGLEPIKHKIIVALITQDVHARDIVDNLVAENVTSLQDFNWQ